MCGRDEYWVLRPLLRQGDMVQDQWALRLGISILGLGEVEVIVLVRVDGRQVQVQSGGRVVVVVVL